MRNGMACILSALCMAALVAGGCAKKELVKSEEGAPAVQAPQPPTPTEVKPVPMEPPVKEQPVKETPIKEEALKETSKPAVAEAALQKIYFDFDSYLLSQAARDILYRNAEWLLKNPSVKAQIEGHCDERGSDEYNLALGESRAKSALNYLKVLGVPAERLSVISYGKEKPAEPGHDEAAWAKNRRAEFVILAK